MCGHVGVAGNIWKTEKEVFKTLLILDQLRGPHGTGIGVVSKDNKLGYMKSSGSPTDLFRDFENDGMSGGLVNENVKVLIGHNRWATVGAKIGKNAHPFLHKHIIGAHNGTLTHRHLSNFPRHKDFEVDSEVVIESLASEGFEKTMDKIHGAWTLIWYDKETQKLNIIRNKERPLWVAWNSIGDSFFWASEQWMLNVAMHRHGLTPTNMREIEVDKLYQLDVSNVLKMKDAELTPVTEHCGFQPPKVVSTPFRPTTGGFQATKTTQSGGVSSSPSGDYTGYIKGKTWDTTTRTWVWPKTSDNVLMLPPNWKEYKDYARKEVDFTIIGSVISRTSKIPYFKCRLLEGNEKIEVRLYAHNHPDKKMWAEHEGYFTGTVKRAVELKGERYLLMELKSVEMEDYAADDEEDTDEDKLFSFAHGELISETEWLARIKGGCAYCTADDVRTEEHEFVKWLDDETFICPDCMTLPTFAEMRRVV